MIHLKSWSAILLALSCTSGMSEESAFYRLRSEGETRITSFDPHAGQLTYTVSPANAAVVVDCTLSLETGRWSEQCEDATSGAERTVTVPTDWECNWNDVGTAFVCPRQDGTMWWAASDQVWNEYVWQPGSGLAIDAAVHAVVYKVPVVGWIYAGYDIIDKAATLVALAPELVGADAYTKLLIINDGKVVSPNGKITIDQELAFAAFCRPAVSGGYAADYATGIEMEKIDSSTGHWEPYTTINLLPNVSDCVLIYDHMLLAKQRLAFPPGGYRISVTERTGFSEDVDVVFNVQSRITVKPNPTEAAAACTNDVDVGTAILVSRPVPKPGWQFVRWGDGQTTVSRWITATETPATYSAIYEPIPHTYQVIRGNFTWHQAKADAEARGGYLATVTSAAENGLISAILPRSPRAGYWLGGWKDLAIPGNQDPYTGWQWIPVSGVVEGFGYNNWSPPQMDNHHGGEDGIHILGDAGEEHGKWNDYDRTWAADGGYVLELEN